MFRMFMSLVCLTMCLGQPAKAHPHVFVDANTGFIFDKARRLTGLRISWTYDEFTTLVLFETLNLDRDGDGIFNDEDRAAVVKGETNWDREYKGDIYFDVAGKNYPLGRPKSGKAKLEDGKITVSFDLPLSQPHDLSGSPAILRLYDPSYYYAYAILPNQRFQNLPKGCQAQINTFKADATTQALQKELSALSREEVPTQQNVGQLFSDEVRLSCE
ncbi:DUF1007 family protein [Planktotalea sp.]|uniref:DUF1007 family protein n=1 Tax=Planktotalea sp. TaxID=2029877 RepID=UPI003D6C157F